MTTRFLIVQTVAACLFAAAWWLGWPQMMYEGDATRITLGIAALGIIGVICEAIGWKPVTDHLIEHVTKYGLFGTVVGLGVVARNSGGEFDAMLSGLGTAFYTTLAGLVVEQHLVLTRKMK